MKIVFLFVVGKIYHNDINTSEEKLVSENCWILLFKKEFKSSQILF
jgi:hypothetical protein